MDTCMSLWLEFLPFSNVFFWCINMITACLLLPPLLSLFSLVYWLTLNSTVVFGSMVGGVGRTTQMIQHSFYLSPMLFLNLGDLTFGSKNRGGANLRWLISFYHIEELGFYDVHNYLYERKAKVCLWVMISHVDYSFILKQTNKYQQNYLSN